MIYDINSKINIPSIKILDELKEEKFKLKGIDSFKMVMNLSSNTVSFDVRSNHYLGTDVRYYDILQKGVLIEIENLGIYKITNTRESLDQVITKHVEAVDLWSIEEKLRVEKEKNNSLNEMNELISKLKSKIEAYEKSTGKKLVYSLSENGICLKEVTNARCTWDEFIKSIDSIF